MDDVNPNPSSADFILASRQGSIGSAINSLDDNPDDAARSMELSKATGVPAPVINGDLEGFEKQHKAKLVSNLLSSNEYLQSFINKDPMAAKVANDDYANLDAVSAKVSALKPFTSQVHDALNLSDKVLPGDPLARFKEGGALGQWSTMGGGDPLQQAITNIATTPIRAIASAGEAVLRGITGAAETAADVTSGAATAVGGPSLGRDIGGIIEAELMGMSGRHGVHGPEPTPGRPPGDTWIENNRKPPAGVVPEFDKIAAEHNAQGVDALGEALKDAQASLTRERSPELFKEFIAQHTDAQIAIDGDAVARLYGDKLPTADDNLLGWIPDIESKLALARATGDDVHIPLADVLANADKFDELFKAGLSDDIRVRPGGITANEVKLAAEQKEAEAKADEAAKPEGAGPTSKGEPGPLPDALPTFRGASALEPLLSVGDRKLTLQPMEDSGPKLMSIRGGSDTTFHDFNLVDEKGNTVGAINLSAYAGGKKLYVDMIHGVNGLGPRDFGPALMRDLLRQIKEQFPEAETITGHRVSGARDKAGSYMAPSAMPVIKLDAPKGWGEADVSDWVRVLEGGKWEQYSHTLQAYIKPYAERSLEDRKLIDAVNEELDRIAPKKLGVQEADRIQTSGSQGQRAGDTITPTGAYVQYRETYPVLLYALEGPDPIGTARHEAIHHLRNYGFFKPEEWAALEKAADENLWIPMLNIADRYPKASRSLLLEESIADAYKHWEAGDARFLGAAPEVEGIFARMRQFFDNLRKRIGELLGKEPSWEDIFEKVSTGEVGAREGTKPIVEGAFDEKLSLAPELRPAVKDEDGSIKIGKPGQMHMEIKARNPIDSGWVDHEGNYLNREQAVAYAEKHFGNNADYLEDMAESGRPATLEEMMEEARKASPEDIAHEYYVTVGSTNHKDALKLFDEDFPDVTQDRKLAAARNIIVRNLRDDALDEKLSVPEGDARDYQRANTYGIPVGAFRQYDKLIQAQFADDLAKAERRAMEEQGRMQTRAWKDERKALRQEVAGEIKSRPDVAADLFFGSGELYGKKVPLASVKLDAALLTDAQKAMLPRAYYGERGLNPDDVANLFGYGSGDTLVSHLAAYNVPKLLAKMSAKDFVSRVTDIETDRQMQLRHGILENNIMDAAKEQALGEVSLERVHEETVFLAGKIGEQPASRGNIAAAVKELFKGTTLAGVDSNRLVAKIGSMGRQVEAHMRAGEWNEAFMLAQKREFAMTTAAEMVKVEKEKASLEKLMKTYAKRWDPQATQSIDPTFSLFNRSILAKVERPYGMSVQWLAENIADSGFSGLTDFVQKTNKEFGLEGVELPVAEWLGEPGQKPLEQLTIEEFKELNEAVRSLHTFGRNVKKWTDEGKSFELSTLIKDLNGQLQTKFSTVIDYGAEGKPSLLSRFVAAHTGLETMWARFDGRDPYGLFTKTFSYPAARAGNSYNRLTRDFAKKISAIEPVPDLGKKIESPLIDTKTGKPVRDFTRANLLTIVQNMGNESNWRIFAKGWNEEPKALWDRISAIAPKEMFDYAQKYGEAFSDGYDLTRNVYSHLYGIAPERLPIAEFSVNHPDGTVGNYAGWYHPAIRDELRSPRKATDPNEPAFANFWPSTSNAYTKKRTGAIYTMSLSQEMIPIKMNQMLHDIAFRPFVHETAKITRDRGFRKAIEEHYGPEYYEAIDQWLKKIAGNASYDSTSQAIAARWSNWLRQNVVASHIGWSLTTIEKHGPTAMMFSAKETGVGPFAKAWAETTPSMFRDAAMDLFGKSRDLGDSITKFIEHESEEIQRRAQNFQETVPGAHNVNLGKSSFREKMIEIGSKGVAFSDRLSADPTWLATYRQHLAETGDPGLATDIADRAVRRAHGSTSVTNAPAIVSNRGVLAPWLSTIYGFWGTRMQRMIELAHDVDDAYHLGEKGDLNAMGKMLPGIAVSTFVYVIWPMIVEEQVSKQFYDDKSKGGLLEHALAYSFGTIAQSVIGLRDIVYGIERNRDVSIGMLSTLLYDPMQLLRDVKKGNPLNKKDAGKFVQDAMTTMGDFGAGTSAHMGAIAHYGIDLATGQQKPKSTGDVYRGFVTGSQEKKVVR